MQKVMCEHCKEEVLVMLYFFDERILKHDNSIFYNNYYEAEVCGRAICPCCGAEVHKTFRKSITKGDIIKLAGGYAE